MRYTVWRRPAATSHSAPIFSAATALSLLLSTIAVVAPLLLAYRSNGFWLRTAEYEEQAEVHWRHEAVLLADLEDGGQLGWSTHPGLQALLGDPRLPVVRSREEDHNRDGLRDQLTLSLALPLRPGEEVVAATVILFFDVRLHKFSSVQMTGLVVLSGSGFPGSGLDVVGDARLVQRAPLGPHGRDTRYLPSPLPPDLSQDLTLASMLSAYSARNLSLRLDNHYSLWAPGRGSPEFTVRAEVRYPVQRLTYRPGLWQVLKWGWVQYLSFLIVSLYLAARARDFVFGQRVLPTLVSPPGKEKTF